MRPGQDVDLLVAEEHLPRVAGALGALGYTLPHGVRGRRTSHQLLYVRELGGGARVQLDVHWRISNRHRFAGSLEWADLRQRAVRVALPAAGLSGLAAITASPGASPPGRAMPDQLPSRGAVPAFAIDHGDAFIHAVVHLYAHHGRGERPALWFEDLRLLVESLVASGSWAGVAHRVEALALGSLARDALVLASARLGWALPEAAWRAARRWPDDSSSGFLRPGRLRDIVSDLAHVPGWAARAEYIAELLVPPVAQMRAGWSEEGGESVLRLHARRLKRRLGGG